MIRIQNIQFHILNLKNGKINFQRCISGILDVLDLGHFESGHFESGHIEPGHFESVFLFIIFFQYLIQHCFICRLSDSTVSEDAEERIQDSNDFGIVCQTL
jgi:hypothetical protein